MRRVSVDNPRYPHHIKIVRKVVNSWLSADSEEDTLIIYEGEGRSYTDTTTTGDSRVDTNKRKASIPMRFDKWGADTADTQQSTEPPYPMSGDILYVTKAHITEEWEVKDFEPDNDRSVIYGEMNRNLNMGDGESQ